MLSMMFSNHKGTHTYLFAQNRVAYQNNLKIH